MHRITTPTWPPNDLLFAMTEHCKTVTLSQVVFVGCISIVHCNCCSCHRSARAPHCPSTFRLGLVWEKELVVDLNRNSCTRNALPHYRCGWSEFETRVPRQGHILSEGEHCSACFSSRSLPLHCTRTFTSTMLHDIFRCSEQHLGRCISNCCRPARRAAPTLSISRSDWDTFPNQLHRRH